ncbi:hypothetical protein [Alteromonas sp. KUL49]|uniref:hypothetical protein n=1 Tax=Alteromonas sp. KUL49 TaxID=2480798 RepID=UPI00102EE34A|nr:hypothetical protein [Alteromonas sp. KUL49]TAP39048.1 hypothetical protein EYS00_14270 [Alteromonas sp. KUL49]GEA12506.1 hypothetical protein KUL49_28810 [Alteromonas sp. KUL49]
MRLRDYRIVHLPLSLVLYATQKWKDLLGINMILAKILKVVGWIVASFGALASLGLSAMVTYRAFWAPTSFLVSGSAENLTIAEGNVGEGISVIVSAMPFIAICLIVLGIGICFILVAKKSLQANGV